MIEDVRWQQRLQNFQHAKAALGRGVAVANERALSELEQQGNTDITGSRDATRAAFAANLLTDGEGWMDMIRSRNLTSHTYHLNVASDIARQVHERFWPAFVAFETRMLGVRHSAGT